MPREPCFCWPCGILMMPVTTDDEAFSGHCPRCQRTPSALERSIHTVPDPEQRRKLRRYFNDFETT